MSRVTISCYATHRYPRLMEPGGAARLVGLFNAFDQDGSATIDVFEWCRCLSLLTRGVRHEMTELIFDVYDLDSSGAISLDKVVLFTSPGAQGDDYLPAANFARDVLSLFDVNGDDHVDKGEFLETLDRHPLLYVVLPFGELSCNPCSWCVCVEHSYDCFVSSMIPGMQQAKAPFAQVGQQMSEFTMESLKALWWQCSGGRHTSRFGGDPKEMTLIQFRLFMQEQFKTPHKMLPVINRVFEALDVDGGGTLSWHVSTVRTLLL